MPETPRRRLRPLLILAALIVILPLAAVAAAALFLDPDALRPRLVAAAERATGRKVEVGRLGIGFSLVPTLTVADVSLANAPWGSRPAMLTARRAEVQVALLPLLSRRVEVRQVTLLGPDLLLERGPQGQGNWEFQDRPGEGGPAPASAPQEQGGGTRFELARLRVEDARLTWRGGAEPVALAIPALEAALPSGGPSRVEGRVLWRGETLAFTAEGGALPALGGAAPWPVRANVAGAGAEGQLQGTLEGRAWRGTLAARAAELARLAPLMPDLPLPPLRDVALRGTATGEGAALRSASDLRLAVGASDLSMLRPGLALRQAEVVAPAANEPLRLSADATLSGTPVVLAGQAGTLAQLLGQAGSPMPLDLRLETAGTTATLRGAVRDPGSLAGVDLAAAVVSPDLAALSGLTGTPLPPVRDLRASARIAERSAGFASGAILRDVRVTSSAGDLGGALTLIIGERPGISGAVQSTRLDLDALMAGPAAAAQAPAGGAAPPAIPPRPALNRGGDQRVIPATPLPFPALRVFDADLRWTASQVTAGGQPFRDVALHLALAEGKGGLSPLTMATPAGPLHVEVQADATAAQPALRVVLRSPGLDLAALQGLAGQPVRVAGTAGLDADLSGTGADLRAQAASLGGHVGIAMQGGSVEPALMAQAQAALPRELPVNLPQRLPLECVALRGEAQGGVVSLPTLLLDSPAAKVAGSGQVDLREERLNLPLQHDIRTAGQVLRLVATLGGTLAEPAYQGVRVVGGLAVLGNLAGQVGGDLGAALGALGGARRPGAAAPPPLPECGPALSAARGDRPGPAPAAAQVAPAAPAAPAQPATPAQPPAAPRAAEDLLRGLLRR